MTNKTEIWKAHPEYSGIEVSTLGRVRTLDRVSSSESMTRFTKGRILKQRKDKYGYLQAHIIIDGKQATKTAHRLVAQTFIPNPDNLPQVNHKDCDRTNNNVSNLEWCDGFYNQQYREKFGESRGLPVFAINLSTLEVSRFSSRHEASLSLGVFQTKISAVIKGKLNQTHGYWFTNANEKAADAIKHKLEEASDFEKALS